MEQRGTKHSARVDDAMAAETEPLTRGAPVESRAEEFLLKEPTTDDGVNGETIVSADYLPSAGALDDVERERRSELAASLRPGVFPAQHHELIAVATSENAPEWVLDALADLPVETRFDNVQAVWDAIGGHRESRGTAETGAARGADETRTAERPATERGRAESTTRTRSTPTSSAPSSRATPPAPASVQRDDEPQAPASTGRSLVGLGGELVVTGVRIGIGVARAAVDLVEGTVRRVRRVRD